MKKFSVYHKETGTLTGQVFMTNNHEVAESFAKANVAAEYSIAEGEFDHQSQRIDPVTGKAIDYVPPAPSTDHEWEPSVKRWKMSAAAQARIDGSKAVRARIEHLEANVQPRAMRELSLGYDGAITRLKDIDDEIIKLRGELEKWNHQQTSVSAGQQ